MEKHKLLIHVGMPKTGTTSLQHFLFDNNDILNSKGWDYPNISNELFLYDYKSRENLSYINAWGLRITAEKSEVQSINQFNNIMKCVLKHLEKYNVILSCEMFWTMNLENLLKKIKSFYEEIQIIVYFRRQDKFIESWWNQCIKNDTARTYNLSEALDIYDEYTNYLSKIQQMEDIVGRENIIVRIFEKEALEPVGKDGDIISDFLITLGLYDIKNLCKPAKRFNDRLSNYLIEVKRLFNKNFLPTIDDENLLEERRKYFLGLKANDLFLSVEKELKSNGQSISDGVLSPQERIKILNQHKEENREIARRYFGRDELFQDMNVNIPYTYYDGSKFEPIMSNFYKLIQEDEALKEKSSQIDFQIKCIKHNMSNKKLAYFGSGEICRNFLNIKKNYPVSLIIDNDIEGNLHGIPIILSKNVKDWNKYIIVITCESCNEIEMNLKNQGLKEYVDFIRWYNLLSLVEINQKVAQYYQNNIEMVEAMDL